jgi:hypothetical protein
MCHLNREATIFAVSCTLAFVFSLVPSTYPWITRFQRGREIPAPVAGQHMLCNCMCQLCPLRHQLFIHYLLKLLQLLAYFARHCIWCTRRPWCTNGFWAFHHSINGRRPVCKKAPPHASKIPRAPTYACPLFCSPVLLPGLGNIRELYSRGYQRGLLMHKDLHFQAEHQSRQMHKDLHFQEVY